MKRGIPRRAPGGRNQLRLAADRVQQVARQREVEHLLHHDVLDAGRGRLVAPVGQRPARAQVRRDRRPLDLDRGLEVLSQVLDPRDRHRQPQVVAEGFDAAQRERGHRERRVRGRDRRQAAAADQIEVLVVPAALVRVHHRVVRLRAHPVRAHVVACAVVRVRLPVVGQVAGIGRPVLGRVRRPEVVEELGPQLPGGGHAGARVVVDVVLDPRARDAERVAGRRR